MAATQKTRGVASGSKRIQRDVLDATRFDIRTVNTEFKQIPIELMKPGMYQTRRNFKPKGMKELAASLETTGYNFNPLIIRPLRFADGYEIICGERRWRAAQLIGLTSLLCCIGDYSDQQAMYLSGADNIQREDINPLEEAQSYDLLLQSGMTQQDVADEIGKSRSHVANHLRLLSLPLSVRDMIGHEQLSFAQARPLCSLSLPGLQINIAREAVAKGWSSKKIEGEVSKAQEMRKRPKRNSESVEDVDIKRLREQVAVQTGYPCAIVKTDKGGWQIGFNAGTTEEFQGILDRLGVNTDML